MATQNLPSVPSAEFPQCALALKSTNQALRDLTFDIDKTLPFLTDGFVERCIEVTDRNLKFTWHDQEEFLYGAL